MNIPTYIINYWEIHHKEPEKIKWIKSCWKERNTPDEQTEEYLDYGMILPEISKADFLLDDTFNTCDGKVYYSDDNVFVISFCSEVYNTYIIISKLRRIGFIVKGIWKECGLSDPHQVDVGDHIHGFRLKVDYFNIYTKNIKRIK